MPFCSSFGGTATSLYPYRRSPEERGAYLVEGCRSNSLRDLVVGGAHIKMDALHVGRVVLSSNVIQVEGES